jgi:hypothetical protein
LVPTFVSLIPHDLGDLAVASVFEIKHDESPVELFDSLQEPLQLRESLLEVGRRWRLGQGFGLRLLERHDVLSPGVRGSGEGDRRVEGHPVHPRREPALPVVTRKRTPELETDLLDQVVALLKPTAVGVGQLEDDASVRLELSLEFLRIALRRSHGLHVSGSSPFVVGAGTSGRSSTE